MTTYDPNSEEHRDWASKAQQQMYEDFMRQQRAHRYHAPPPPPPRPQFAAIPPDILKRLIMLCHPDKHDGSKMSQEIIQWLLKQRV